MRPSILLIMVDDMGWCDLGCYGSEIRTPNLDALAREGTRFSQFYNTARCCPSRAALLTGMYPHQAGVGHMIDDRGRPAYQGYLNERPTVAEMLREGGYATYMSGKWHVGEEPPHWPRKRGFDRYFGLISGASNYWRLDAKRKMALDDEPWTPPTDGSFFMTDAFTDHAVQCIREHHAGPRAEQPFFHYVAYTAPHWPLHAHEEDIARYRGVYERGWDVLRAERHAKLKELGLVDPQWALSPRHPTAPAWDELPAERKAIEAEKMAVYAAQVDRMDQGVGRILAALRETGAMENTIVMFLSDNGGCAEGIDRGTPGVPPGGPESFLSYGLPWANASNTPLRLFKQWVHEGGIATPLIARGPGVKQGAVRRDVGHVIDLTPTCLEYAGVKRDDLEGRSLRAVFEGGQRAGHEAVYWEHQGHRAMRQGRWKLVAEFGGAWELYDLEADRTETQNLAASQPERVRELERVWQAWADRVGVEPWEDLRRK
jgi:arylsulfatase A-like enzyme